ncbi:hypothetical protein NQ317_013373 [Molorchus minor]|uniref:Uncharacterized protein n=1 Tax=Molorchus minor TaxID=1323400 RepID=A0ABQ9J1M5_9CUCU|nr:hypothetical protein NQ317_013373 [Molorchus minor]
MLTFFLKRRSLYVMNGTARFDYTHEILNNEHSFFNGEKVLKGRRFLLFVEMNRILKIKHIHN